MRAIRRLLLIAAPLTLLVIAAGAFTRLSDAGLGCPDWPACYGQIIGVPDAAAAAAHSPQAPLDTQKAWIEVGHRYVAGLLGLVLLAAAVLSLRLSPLPRAPLILAALVLAQAFLGMLTVTGKLQPLVVSAHLLGGMFIFSTIMYALISRPLTSPSPLLLWAGGVAAAVLVLQVFLGGWVSANHAALACPDFPLCQGGWLPPVLEWSGFSPFRELHLDISGAPVSAAALSTIHWAHRLGALVTVLVLGGFGVLYWRAGGRGIATGLWILLAVQVMLGIINVAAALPLWSALLHNTVAALIAAKISMMIAKINLAKAATQP